MFLTAVVLWLSEILGSTVLACIIVGGVFAIVAIIIYFASVRTGRANAMALDRIKVDYYGVPTPVNQMAGVKTPDAR